MVHALRVGFKRKNVNISNIVTNNVWFDLEHVLPGITPSRHDPTDAHKSLLRRRSGSEYVSNFVVHLMQKKYFVAASASRPLSPKQHAQVLNTMCRSRDRLQALFVKTVW